MTRPTPLQAAPLVAASLLLLALAPAPAPPQDDPEAIQAELDRFQGTWRVDRMTLDGRQLDGDEVAGRRVIIIDDRYVVIDGDRTIQRGRFALDPSARPKRIDTIPADGPNRGKVDRGIYEILDDGRTLRLCYAPPGDDRPDEFSAPAGSRRWVSVDKKVTAGEP